MQTSFQFLAPIEHCGYLPDQMARMEYEHVSELTAAEYAERMMAGWRRFGHTLFRPRCPRCQACRSLRVNVDRFSPNRSQKRARKANERDVQLQIGPPRLASPARAVSTISRPPSQDPGLGRARGKPQFVSLRVRIQPFPDRGMELYPEWDACRRGTGRLAPRRTIGDLLRARTRPPPPRAGYLERPLLD